MQARAKIWTGLMFVVAGAFAACEGSETSTPPPPDSGFGVPSEPNAILFNAVDYAFADPASFPSEVTEFTLSNQGAELHHQQLIKLPEGMTTGDFMAVLAELPPDAPPSPGIEMAGGVSVIAPGVTGTITLDLMAGN